MPAAETDEFVFSRYLKILSPELTNEQRHRLLAWNALNQNYMADIQSFQLNPSSQSSIEASQSIQRFIAQEADLNILYSQIFLQIPSPETARHQWDAGAEKRHLTKCQQALSRMKEYSQCQYAQAKQDASSITEYRDDKPNKPVRNTVETTLILMNNTPYRLELTATVVDDSQWSEGDNRPDENIKGPLVINPFKEVSLKEDIASQAKAAEFVVNGSVSFAIEGSTEKQTEEFLFSADQYLAIEPPVITEEQSEAWGLPLNSETLSTTNPDYWLLQMFPAKDSNEKTLTLSISEKHGSA